MSDEYVTTAENFGQLVVQVSLPFQCSEETAYDIKNAMQTGFPVGLFDVYEDMSFDEEDGSMEFVMATTNIDTINKFVSELNTIVGDYVKSLN